MKRAPSNRMLYDPRDHHDACGVGFVADISGKPSNGILETALEALSNLAHRGAVSSDGRSGDGAGVLTQLPKQFFGREIGKFPHSSPRRELAVGVFFLPRDRTAAKRCRAIIEHIIASFGFETAGWRRVPIEKRAAGPDALAAKPRIEQLLLTFDAESERHPEATLRIARKAIERASELGDSYVVSLSSRTIVYKGMLSAEQLERFYPDLRDHTFETAFAVFHQRYSTNTFPNWSWAQPFRMIAHNGEINTIAGNRNWMEARRQAVLRTHPEDPLYSAEWGEGSDSSSLDKAVESVIMSGADILESMMTLIPEAYENSTDVSHDLRAFYEYASLSHEPWDGPAAVMFTDGRYAGAALDRNGLRPARYAITTSGRLILTSEAGAVATGVDEIAEKGRLGPGEMIAVDMARGILLRNSVIKKAIARRHPFAEWLKRSVVSITTVEQSPPLVTDERDLVRRMKSFGYTLEDVDRILVPMMGEAKEPIGSMGDDTPLAVFSAKPRLLYTYVKQKFAQVTNPPIDPIRERLVMSLHTPLGPRATSVGSSGPDLRVFKLNSPLISCGDFESMKSLERTDLKLVSLPATFELELQDEGLESAVDSLCSDACASVESGATILVIDDTAITRTRAAIPMVLAIAAVHKRLIECGLRVRAGLVAKTGEARDDHQIACLLGFGANAVYPELAYEVVAHEARRRGGDPATSLRKYTLALQQGLLKIMAKMGIATAASFCGAQPFEIIGLDQYIVDTYLCGATSRVGGIGLREIARDIRRFHSDAHTLPESSLEDAGYFRYRKGGEHHSFNPAVLRALHRSAKKPEDDLHSRYEAEVIARPPATLRDLIGFRSATPIDMERVEPTAEILTRFSTSGMSLGALSTEAHEAVAVAMNALGARSNSGEGGEDSRRFNGRRGGTASNSRIKQVASARFGVTPAYLVSADEIEIKMAQGSKPGEGGQLPGHKVTAEIAALRHSTPGGTLISPPPHHDIYSIEDLAQLIYDLRQVNPAARIAVKLVSEAGIGAIAAGVSKAGADVIHVSGHDGGTGASPLGSIKNAGTPWELGLAETQQALTMNNLRTRVRLRVDGGLKTARDVLIAAMLGADEFGFATTALVALGCVMARRCHLNTCPVGIATQNPVLRRKFSGTPENVINFFTGLAENVRKLLAQLGFTCLAEVVGRCDLLVQQTQSHPAKTDSLDLSAILSTTHLANGGSISSGHQQSFRTEDESLGKMLERVCADAIGSGLPLRAAFEIRNTDRAVGARLAGAITRERGDAGLSPRSIDLTFTGSAGQSFGAFNAEGMRLKLIGEANDYVCKSMRGGEIIIRPPAGARYDWSKSPILGNTALYGATGGTLFAAGRAGERFAVRNSGAVAVVEGVGDHGCEYMTAGQVLVLGETGRNFAAGMTGGVAYVFDSGGNFGGRCNQELVRLDPMGETESRFVRALIDLHARLTGSPRALLILQAWRTLRKSFFSVVPREVVTMRDERRPIATPVSSGLRRTAATLD